MRYIQFDPNGGCWLWDSGVTKNGYLEYPIFTLRVGKQQRVARFMYEARHGPIPEGLIVRHTCDVSMCVNPDHLILGTHKDNAHDRDTRGRGTGGRTQPVHAADCPECGITFLTNHGTWCSKRCTMLAYRRRKPRPSRAKNPSASPFHVKQ